MTNLSFRKVKKLLLKNQLTVEDVESIVKNQHSSDTIKLIADSGSQELKSVLAKNIVNLMPSLYSYYSTHNYEDTFQKILAAGEANDTDLLNALRYIDATSEAHYAGDNIRELFIRKLSSIEILINESKKDKDLIFSLRAALHFDDFSADDYENMYLHVMQNNAFNDPQHTMLLHKNHLPSSILYVIVKENPDLVSKYANVLKNNPNLTPEIIELLPDSVQEYATFNLNNDNFFKEINKKLTKPLKTISLEEGLETEAFKNSENYAKFVERKDEFELVGTSLKASQHLAEMLLDALNAPLPLNLNEGLTKVKAKTIKLYTFYEKLLSSPFNAQGDRALAFAKRETEEAIKEYEDIINSLLNLTENKTNSKELYDDFDKLKADTKTCNELEILKTV